MLAPGDRGWPEDLDADPAAVFAMATALGIKDPIGGAFACVLHEPCEASLRPTASNGHWLYYCDAKPAGIPLARLRALQAGRESVSSTELGTWKRRLLVESGLQTPAEIRAARLTGGMLQLMGRNAAIVEAVWEGFLLLLRCRWIDYPGQAVTYTREFAAAWCGGLKPEQTRHAINALIGVGLMVKAGSTRAANRDARLWLPALESVS